MKCMLLVACFIIRELLSRNKYLVFSKKAVHVGHALSSLSVSNTD